LRPRELAAGRITAALLICAVSASGATIGTSSYLHVNLSYMPFSYYDTSHPAASYGFTTTVNGTNISSCPAGSSVRSCFQTILGQLQAQGVTGIRIFVTFCDSTSLAFTVDGVNSTCGYPWYSPDLSWSPSTNQYEAAWIANVGTFFQDVAGAGIPNVTITTGASAAPPPGQTSFPTLPYDLAGSPENPAGCDAQTCCPDTPAEVYYNPMNPYGQQSNGIAIGNYWSTNSNQGYNCAPINPFFLGWTNYFDVIGAILGKAQAAALSVYELEIQEEVNTTALTVLMRYFYDNALPQSAPSQYVDKVGGIEYVNVLSALRSLMSASGFDPGRVAYSAFWTDATTATANCGDAYGDYARNLGLDTVFQTISGGLIGMPQDYLTPLSEYGDLICGGTLSYPYNLQPPIYSSQPDIVDVHIYPRVLDATNTDAMIQEVAALDYSDVPYFLTSGGLQSANIVIGETWGGTLSHVNLGTSSDPNYCWLGAYSFPSGAPAANVAGFNSEGVTSPLSGFTVTFRPWMELEDPSGACYAYGGGAGTSGNYQGVNYQGKGPYTPTNK
jgi:hypothetical protein